MYRETLIEFKQYFTVHVFDKFNSHLNEFDREEVNYIFNLIDDCLFNPYDIERIRLLHTELNGLFRFNYMHKPMKYMFMESILHGIKILQNLLRDIQYEDNL